MKVNKEPGIHLSGLNGLRTIASISVVVSHTAMALNKFGFKEVFNGWDFAEYGVTMFFTLSGFLITYLLDQEKEVFKTVNLKQFYIRRILRIWPLYFLYLLIIIPFLIKFFPDALPGSIYYYLFLAANLAAALQISLPLLTHFWSLGVEEQFYLIWPVLFKKFSAVTALLLFMGFFMAIKLCLRFTLPESVPYYFLSITKFDCMGLGAFFAISYRRKPDWVKTICFNKFVQIACWILWCITAMGYLKLWDIINHNLFSLATGIIIINVAFNRNALISLENRLFNFIGKLSFGIYVYHVLVIFILSKLLGDYFSAGNAIEAIIIFILVLFCTIVISYFSYRFVEKRFLLLKRKFSKIHSRA